MRRLEQALSVTLGLAVAAPGAGAIDPALLAGLEARSIGPAAMSGRVAAVVGLTSDPETLYVGAATGGVWRSRDGGLTWEPIFDDQPVASIGAIAVFQRSPDVIWVGTGEGNPRNSASVGDGVYRSIDGGESWTHLGLAKSERIHRILLHPEDPQVAFVAALGTSWGENPERGVFKTTDGGRSWRKVLFVDERTGAADLVLDPTNPDKLIAAMWDHRRWPWFFRSGGPGSGIYVTHDGGATWGRQTPEDGLPEGDLGRIGLAIAPSDPERVYALVEASKENVLLRSDDGGGSWQEVAKASEQPIGNRPFYYADLRVDPADRNRVYSLWSRVSVSEDAGKSWETLVPFQRAHPDHHAMWIDPNDPAHIVEGNDGGVYISRDRGGTWKFVRNLPLAQIYHLRVDDEAPYNVYFGLQDNGSWKGPSEVWENGGIRDQHWREVAFGDGFDVVPMPGEASRGWAMSQEGFLVRWDLSTGERKAVRPVSTEEEALRFNWNAAIAIDPFDERTLYFGSQYVHRSRDGGDSWEVVSPDLTTDNPDWQKQAESGGLTLDVTGAENFTSLVALAPSRLERGLIWAGTDDGRLHVTRDGGATWTSVEGNLRGVPPNTWVPHIEPSQHDPATAYAVFDDHRRASWTPYVLRTTDYGASWTSLATDDLRGYCLAIAEDPVDPDLLFLGTELGLYVTVDGGRRWMRWRHGVPTVSVMDLTVHRRDHDLILGTHGRAVYILDDVSPLRGLTEEVLEEPLHLFAIPDAQQHWVAQTGGSRFPGQGEFRGENAPYGALVTYSLNVAGLPHPDEEVERERKEAERAEKRRQGGGEEESEASEEEPRRGDRRGRRGPQVEIEVRDAAGELIRTFEGPAELGVNRAVWNLRRDDFKQPPRDEPSFFDRGGPEVLPGRYTLRVVYKDHEASGTVEVLADPRFDIPIDDREAKEAAVRRAGRLQEVVVEAIERIHRTRSDVETILAKARAKKEAMEEEGGGRESEDRASAAGAEEESDADDEPASPQDALLKAGRELLEGLGEQEKRLWQPPDTKGILADRDALAKVRRALSQLGSSWQAPTAAQLGYLEIAERAVAAVLPEVNGLFEEEVAAFRDRVREAGIELLPAAEPLALPE